MRSALNFAFAAIISAALAACSGTTSSSSLPASHVDSVARTTQSAHASGPSLNGMVDGHPAHVLLPRNAASTRGSGGNLVYHGGPIQKNPVIYVVYWGFTGTSADPDGVAPYLTSFLQGIGGSPLLNVVTQYSSSAAGNILNPVHQFKGEWFDNDSIPNQPSGAQIANEAERAAAHFGYNYDASYIVALPHGSLNHLGYCAYHSVASTAAGDVHYTDLPYQPDFPGCGVNSVNSGAQGLLDSTSETAVHEVAETQTDPDTRTGWYDNYGNEIGDYCSYINLQNVKLSTGTYAIQPLWSNAASYCATSY